MSRKLILYIAMSLDGYIARKDGDVDWLEGDGTEIDADMGYEKFYKTIDTVIMGSKTYEQILTFGEYPYKGTKGYVYTTRNLTDNEDVVFTNEKPKKLIDRLKEQQGNDIWIIGGANILDDFIKNNLIDEYIIAIIPTILGEGISLFNHKNPEMKLKLYKTETVNGIVLLYYCKR